MVGYILSGMGMCDVIERCLVNVGSVRKSSGEYWEADIDLLQIQSNDQQNTDIIYSQVNIKTNTEKDTYRVSYRLRTRQPKGQSADRQTDRLVSQRADGQV